MARIWLSEIAQDIRGSIANHTYSIWKGLNYLRQKAASITNPCSVDQENTRARTSASAKRWYSNLTNGQRVLWNEYAAALPPKAGDGGSTKQVIPDNRGVMSGFNVYVAINGWAFSAGVSAMDVFTDDAPIGIDAPNAPTGLTCGWESDLCIIRLTWVDPLEVLEDSMIRIWGVSLDGGPHKQLIDVVALATETYDVDLLRIALGAQSNVRNLPGHYHIQIDCIGPNGQKSPPSNVCQVTVPAGCTPA